MGIINKFRKNGVCPVRVNTCDICNFLVFSDLFIKIWNKIAGRRVFVRFYLRSWNWKRHGAIPSAPLDIGNESVIWKPGPGHGNIVNIEIQRGNFLHARQKYLPQERPCHNDYSQLFQHA